MHLLTRLFNHFQRTDFLLMLHRPAMDVRAAAEWYPDWVYETMETDEARNARYRAVINRHARGKVVLELGAGRQALWSRYCVSRGAERVYAVEANRRAFERSREALDIEGHTRVRLLNAFSDRVSLPERCEVLVHDLVGAIGSAEGMVGFVRDAKERHLSADAVHIPKRCQTFFFPTARPQHTAAEWAFSLAARLGRPIRSLAQVQMYGYRPGAMLARPQLFEDISFALDLPRAEDRVTEFTVHTDGWWEAFTFFIRLHVDDGHVIDSLAERTNWYLPYVRPFDRPVFVRVGDVIRVASNADYHAPSPTFRLTSEMRAGKTPFTPLGDYSWTGV